MGKEGLLVDAFRKCGGAGCLRADRAKENVVDVGCTSVCVPACNVCVCRGRSCLQR